MKIGAKGFQVHPHYKEGTWDTFNGDNDIAMVRLSKDLDFNSYIQPIALPSENHTDSQLQMVKFVKDK